MADKRSLYEENFIMHSENARLCRKIEAFERDMEYRTHVSELVSSYEARNRKLERALEKERKERARYHDLWQEQVKRDRLNRFTDEDIAIDDLKAELEELKKVNEQLTVQLQKAEEQIKKLRAQMNRDHENSSIPSSQKPFHKKIPNSRIRTDRKPGGQPGHQGHRRPSPEPTEPAIILPPPEEISGNDDFYPTGQFIIKRVADLHIGFNVKEYRAEVWRSRSTGKRVHASFPEGVTNEFNYGSNAKALAFLLTDYCNVSIDKTSEIRSTYDRILDTAASEYRQKSPSGYYRNGKNLSKRLAEYKDAHLYFLEHPEVAYTNNLAERSLRKIKRKMKQAVTFRSKDTAVHLCNCMSVIETGKLQGADIFSTSVKAFS